MAKNQMVVIKKITINGAGAHGGSWKVAFADFMTAMMAFFLVMWLLNQSEETKKQVARYFSGPSVIEQNFSIYGAEITLEKLFLDITNEPMKAFQQFVQPADVTPDIMSLGSKRAALFHIAQELGDAAQNVEINQDEIYFEIPDHMFFERGTANPSARHKEVMEKLKDLVVGLENSSFEVTSLLYSASIPPKATQSAEDVTVKRMDLLKNQIDFQSDSNTLKSTAIVSEQSLPPNAPGGLIKIRIKQNEFLPDGSKPRPLKGDIKEKKSDTTVYNDFVRRMTESTKRRR
ncbi:MAG: flagellar motor protein MotB [Bdellovibrionales bacterium]